jgi:hypothetical protein
MICSDMADEDCEEADRRGCKFAEGVVMVGGAGGPAWQSRGFLWWSVQLPAQMRIEDSGQGVAHGLLELHTGSGV